MRFMQMAKCSAHSACNILCSSRIQRIASRKLLVACVTYIYVTGRAIAGVNSLWEISAIPRSSYFPSVVHRMKQISVPLVVRIYTSVADAVTFNKLSEHVRIAERPVIGRELLRIFVGCLDRLLLLLPPPPPPLLLLPPPPPLLFYSFVAFSVSLCETFNRLSRTPSML